MLRRILGLAALLTLVVAGCSSDDEIAPQPNIVLILVDELRADTPGVAGHPFFQSPCMDRIADEGARFTESFVVTSLCSPSRATMLTGLHTMQHGVRNIWSELDTSLETIGTLLQEQGYETAFVGKSHLNRFGTPLPGFDRWYSFAGQGNYVNPRINVDGVPQEPGGYMTDLLTAEALRFMQVDRGDRPYLLILSHLGAHRPWTPDPDLAVSYAMASLPLPESWDDDTADQPEWLACREIDAYDEEAYLRYFDVLAAVEESTCQVLATLETTGQLGDTMVIFTGDNGYFLGEHRLEDKRAAYEESIRVPLFVRYPRSFRRGTVVTDELALNLDLAPTILSAAGLNAGRALPGVRLQDLAAGRVHRDRFLYVYYQDLISPEPHAPCTPTMMAIRTLDHILVDYEPLAQRDELYDLRVDPLELDNLIESPEMAALADSLRAELDALRSSYTSVP